MLLTKKVDLRGNTYDPERARLERTGEEFAEQLTAGGHTRSC